MDILVLLQRARDAGLQLEAAGQALKVKGPRQAEALVKLLAKNKAAVLAALEPRTSTYWRERFDALVSIWSNGRSETEARRLAWSDLQNEWHQLHGRRWPAWQCAGCEKPLSSLSALDLPCGNRVHLADLNCLVTFGCRW